MFFSPEKMGGWGKKDYILSVLGPVLRGNPEFFVVWLRGKELRFAEAGKGRKGDIDRYWILVVSFSASIFDLITIESMHTFQTYLHIFTKYIKQIDCKLSIECLSCLQLQWSLALPAKFKLPTIASQVIPTSKAEASSLYELSGSMVLPTYPGKMPQTSPVFAQKKLLQKLLVKGLFGSF